MSFVDLSQPLVPFLDLGQHRFDVGFLSFLLAKFAVCSISLGQLSLGAGHSSPSLLQMAK
jgi:hypothetical protein